MTPICARKTDSTLWHGIICLVMSLVALFIPQTSMAGCLLPPQGPLRELADRVGGRPDQTLTLIDKIPATAGSAENEAWRQAVRAEAFDLLSQSQDARRVAQAAMAKADPRWPVYVELLVRFAFNGWRKAEADEAAAKITLALARRPTAAEAICLHAALGEVERIRSNADKAILLLSSAYSQASRLKLSRQRVVVAEKLSHVMGWGGDYSEAISLIDEVASWEAAHDESYSLANSLYFRAMYQLQRGEYEQSLRDLERSRAVGSETNDVLGSAFLNLQICRVLIELKKIDRAASLCRSAEQVFVASGEDNAAEASLQLSRIAFLKGHVGEALRRLDAIMASPAAYTTSVRTNVVLRLRARVNEALGRRAAALADMKAYVGLTDKENAVEREKQLLVQRARFATDRQVAQNRELLRDLAFAREREENEGRQRKLIYSGVAIAFLLLCTIVFMGFHHRRRLMALADIDSLTDLLNRRAISHRAPTVIARAHEQNRPVALILVDLDHFKRINDTYGHSVGDRVLKRFATAATATLRGDDLIARWGGEEFVFLLAGLTERELRSVLDRLRQRLAREEFVSGDPVAVRFSAGMSLPALHESFEAAVARADEALYEAKRRGRNRTVTSTPRLVANN